jgi:hypothetical protein
MEVATMILPDYKRVQAERWQADNRDNIEMQWFLILPEAKEWIGDNCGWIFYWAMNGTHYCVWIKS